MDAVDPFILRNRDAPKYGAYMPRKSLVAQHHQKAIATMASQQPGEIDAVTAVGHLITKLGVAALVALIADITEQQSDYFLLSGEHQKATQYMRDVRILQQTAHVLRNPSQ